MNSLQIAEVLNRNLYDTDELITEKQKMTPAEIIRKNGEPMFRDIEADICSVLAERQNIIISTGGGAVLRKENVQNLKKNGLIFFIDRAISSIKPTDDRPLSNSQEKLEQLYKVRYPIYKAAADYHIVSDNIIPHTIEAILCHCRACPDNL